MKTIQHEDTGYIAEIADDATIPSRWYEIKKEKICDETKTDTSILKTSDGNSEIWAENGEFIEIEGQNELTIVISLILNVIY